jgi:uncharacterized protein DUF6883
MKLPNAHVALVEREKLLDYLLNGSHPDNGGKAEFFIGLGFSPDRWSALAHALVQLAEDSEIVASMESVHGIKYIVDGRLKLPSGKSSGVRTVWIIDKGDERPRLVTAYPRKEHDNDD